MYKSTGFDIDVVNTMANPGYLYTDSGDITAVGISGSSGSLVTKYDCNNTDSIIPVNFFIEPQSQILTPYYGSDYNTGDNCVQGTHIGGLLVQCIDCRIFVMDILQPEADCLEYQRGFSPSFSDAFSVSSIQDTCDDGASYSSGFGPGFDISE